MTRKFLKGLLLPFSLALISCLSGCSELHVLDPKGSVGAAEKSLIITSTVTMLIVVIPVIILTLFFAWRYRASNRNATYAPKWAHSTAIEVVVWTIPTLIILFLGILTWKTTHELDPYKPLESSVKPINVEVVALDWKWLFIYPDLGIATVNQVAFPVGTPVNFRITSDSVMNSFFIPQLGSQIYAMAGMQTRLHLIADEAGDYAGVSANYSGQGYLGHEIPGARQDARTVRRLGRKREGVLGPARHGRLQRRDEAEREAAGQVLLDGRFEALSQHHRQVQQR